MKHHELKNNYSKLNIEEVITVNLYVKIHLLLFADTFESFETMCIGIYNLDPSLLF